MKVLTRERMVYSLCKTHPPAIEVGSGEILRVETYDARAGTIRSELDHLDCTHFNPATGPILVKDAQTDDSLTVEILEIDLSQEGFVAVKAQSGLLAHKAHSFVTRMVPVRDGKVIFSDHIKFPVRPMVGVIGTAPEGEGVNTDLMGPHGGNMDNRYVTIGATVHLPVLAPGGLLCLGDVHATMGDGEISSLGLEICADVTIRVSVNKGVTISRPWIETATVWVTTGEAVDPIQALQMAAEEMTMLLQRQLGLTFEEAYMLVSARGDVQICQVCGPNTFPVTTRAVFPRVDV